MGGGREDEWVVGGRMSGWMREWVVGRPYQTEPISFLMCLLTSFMKSCLGKCCRTK